MISDESCDTEDWSNGCCTLKYIKTENKIFLIVIFNSINIFTVCLIMQMQSYQIQEASLKNI